MAEQINNDYYKYGFFSAFTTLPSFEKADEFFNAEICEIFKKYRDALLIIQSKACNNDNCAASQDDSFLHRPVPYCLFGDFDMAVFSLIDDFSFATKKFKPLPTSEGYKYQINTGIIPYVEAYNAANSKIDIFTQKAIPEFFDGTDFYPFCGIGSIKLNNAMLVGIGQPFLKLYNFFLITYLDVWTEKMNKSGKKFFYFLNENLGWNELTIYFFGSSLKEMQELIMTIRQYRLRDIKEHIEGLLGKPEYSHVTIRKDILPIFDIIESQSLLGKLIIEENEGKEYLESHPVIASSINFGFHVGMINLYQNEALLKARLKFSQPDTDFAVFKKEYEEQKCIRIGWKIKPGHEHAANELIKKCFPGISGSKINDNSRTGKFSFRFPHELISIKAYLAFCQEIEKINRFEISKHIIKVRSHLRWESDVDLRPFNAAVHYDYKLEKYQIQAAQVEKIRNQLRVNPIPYIYKGQIENLITNYNDAVADPLMYNYFIGLKMPLINFLQEKFLAGMPEEVLSSETDDSTEMGSMIDDAGKDQGPIRKDTSPDEKMLIAAVDTETIAEFIQAWNKAYWNRYFHSYYFSEINDFNIEHHGGIQQLLFTYDVIYKLIARRIYGADTKVPFVNVQVNHFITSTQYFNSINFTHLFRPAIYACECVHEVANHIIPYLIDKKEAKEFSFLFNPRSSYDQIDPEKARDFLAFEERLHRKVNPREKFEVLYLTEHFGANAIRHMVADYATYLLGYTDPYQYTTAALARKMDMERVKIFYQSHWYLFLIRADLYYRELSHNGGWFFKQDDFTALFIRFNLMLHLFLDFTEADLNELNRECPSIELKSLWESEKINLIKLTMRLGTALRSEFEEQLKERGITGKGFPEFRDKIDEAIFDENWGLLGNEQDFYKTAIKYNQELIFSFHELFTTGKRKHNVIIRNSKNKMEYPFECNISFHERDENRDVFLDPKGNLFSTSPESRQEIFSKNISYIKKMWSLSLQVVPNDY